MLISIMLKNDVVLIQLCNTLVCQLFFLVPAITAASLAFISQGSFSHDDSDGNEKAKMRQA